jgi:hypothetical protein
VSISNDPIRPDGEPRKKYTMRYLMLINIHTARWAELSSEERNQIHADCGVWNEDLVRAGKSVDGVALQPPSTATTLREENGKVSITDGPFAETKEVLGGFAILECVDLDEALAIAKRFPGLRVGTVLEVRPLMTGPCVD